MKKIALVGAGNRTKNYNLPILDQMRDKIEIVGVATKSGKLSPDSGLDKIPVFDSITKMVEETKPEAVLVSIKSSALSGILDELLALDLPILLETTDNFEVYAKIKQGGNEKIGILEQWPFLPMEKLKKGIIDSEALGRILVVENNFRTYDYHGSAQIRNYLQSELQVANLKGHTSIYGSEPFVDKKGSAVNSSSERIRVKTGVFQDGTLLIYKYSDVHKKMPFRGHSTLNIYGTKGSIVAGCLLDEYCDINVLDEEGTTHNLRVNKEYDGENIRKLSVELPNSEEIVWENKYKDLSEQQLATAYLFEEMLVKGNIIYSVEDTIQDMVIAYSE